MTMTREAEAKLPSDYRFELTGMDCAACGAKIEIAVSRISGASKVAVGMQTESLTVNLDTPEKVVDVAETVQKLGYGIKQKVARPLAGKEIGHSDDVGHGHPEHGEPIDGPWWKSQRGLFVILTGLMIGLARSATALTTPQHLRRQLWASQ